MPAPFTVSPGSSSRSLHNGSSRLPRQAGCPCRDSWRILLAGALALLLISTFGFTGCGMLGGGKKKDTGGTSSTGGSDPASFNLMITQKTGLNKLGPDQTTPPEMYLSAGTRIRMVQNMGTSVEIETISGDRGFVATSDVGPLMQ